MGEIEVKFIPELSWTERDLPQYERTKHVHGIHPYLGKFVPQIVDFFLERYFRKGSFVLDPFVGSGTTVIEANTHSMNSAGIDVSEFNILLCKVKISEYDLQLLKYEFKDIVRRVKILVDRKSSQNVIEDFLDDNPLTDTHAATEIRESSEYLKKWFHKDALLPMLYFRDLIPNYHYQDALKILLSRVARSSRMIPHFQLDFPSKPYVEDYYCHKHKRICHPTRDALGFMTRYSEDTFNRIASFQKLRTHSPIELVHGDSRIIKLPHCDGVITSPPYIGLIDYHDQHRYAYELLGLRDKSESEIGAKRLKNGKAARSAYQDSIAKVIKRLADSTDGPIIFVVNDKYELYEAICEDAGVEIKERLKRKVDRRTGRRSNGDFAEDIIVMGTN